MLLLCVFAALFLLSKAVHPMGERPFFAFPRNCIFRTISVAYSSIIYLYLPFPALSRIISLDKRFAPNRKKATVTKCALTEICIAPLSFDCCTNCLFGQHFLIPPTKEPLWSYQRGSLQKTDSAPPLENPLPLRYNIKNGLCERA